MDRTALVRRTVEITNKANTVFGLNIATPNVEFFSTGAAAGFAQYSTNTVKYNEVLAKENGDEFDFVVIHEIGHLVTRKLFPKAKQAHGPEFRYVMRSLGGKESTRHSFDVSSVKVKRKVKRFIAKCNCRTHSLTSAKAKELSRFHCKYCKSALALTGEIKII